MRSAVAFPLGPGHPAHFLQQLAVRMILLGLLGSFSGILSAVLAWGITFMNGAGGLSAWRWMFLFEGLAGLVLAAIAFVWLPNCELTHPYDVDLY